MSRVAILVWLAAAPPSPEQQRQLDDWSRSHQLQLEAPDATAAPKAADFQALVKRLEAKLSAARLALDTLSYVKALTLLRSVQLTLAAHPEIPQAAFLRAHALRLEVRARSHDGASEGDRRAARALEQAATALEGPRAAPYGATQSVLAVSRRERLRIRGTGETDEVFLDGELVSDPVEVLPGEHHVRVLRHDQLVWAGWQRIAPGQRTLQLRLPPAARLRSRDSPDGSRARWGDRGPGRGSDLPALGRGSAGLAPPGPAGARVVCWQLVRPHAAVATT